MSNIRFGDLYTISWLSLTRNLPLLGHTSRWPHLRPTKTNILKQIDEYVTIFIEIEREDKTISFETNKIIIIKIFYTTK